MKLAVGIPIYSTIDKVKEQTRKTISLLKENQSEEVQYIFYDNGCDLKSWLDIDDEDIVIHSDVNVGLPISMNAMLDKAKEIGIDYIFFTHTDVEVYEGGWDVKVKRSIIDAGNVGIAGFFGAYGVGTNDIYKIPYSIGQLSRIQPCAGHLCRLDTKFHGHSQFNEEWRKVACLDGFSQIIKVDSDIRLDESFGPMDAYDTDLGVQSNNLGLKVICINMDCDHKGGVTNVGENWNKVFNKEKWEIHRDAHAPFYEKWKPGNKRITLPFRV